MSTFKEQINSNKPVLVDFYATWCGPCKAMAPVLEALSHKIDNKGKVLKVDVDKNPAAAQAYKINSVPTFILFKHGKPVWRKSGMCSESELKQVIEKYA